VTILIFGDFLQLPPVKGRLAYETELWKSFTVFHLLTNVRAQQDQPWASLLDNEEFRDAIILTPTKARAALKIGARVMLIYNLRVCDGLVNGSIGTVLALHDKHIKVN